MYTDLGKFTVHINRYHIHNWALGIDYWRIYSVVNRLHEATVLQLNFLFFNITFTKWC